jgi:hypothetical protein
MDTTMRLSKNTLHDTFHAHTSAPAGRRTAADAPDALRKALTLSSALVLAALVLALAPRADAALYKWSDERGVVHYSDKMPADAVNRASLELNRQGLTVRKTEQARPVVQRLPKTETEEQRARETERDRMLALRRDRALMESYTNEGEIELAKGRAVATIEGQAQSAEAFIAQMQKRREELESKMGTYAPRPVPGEIKREIETIDAELSRQTDFVAARKKEAATVAARYDSDKQRFRELRSGQPTGSVMTSDDGRFSATQPATLQLTNGTVAAR